MVFAATFLMRPLGGWLFGYIADHYGRRISLTLSVVFMCFGSLIIALTPTYATIGFAAPVILALARVIQGLSLGGEYGASATYLSEVADPKHRGFYSSFQYVTLIGGQLTAIIVLLLLQKVFLTPEELRAWGWRIPFVIGAALAIFAAVMRRNLHETEAFEEAKKVVKPTGSLARSAKISARVAAGSRPHRRRHRGVLHLHHLHADVRQALGRPDRGPDHFRDLRHADLRDHPAADLRRDLRPDRPQAAADLLRRRRHARDRAAADDAEGDQVAFHGLPADLRAWMFVAGYTSINAVVKAELFPTNVRALGVGLPYAITVSIFGGTAPAIALYFKSIGHEEWFYYYLAGIICLSLIIYSTMRDTKHESAMHRHE